MDPALLRERDAFKKRAISNPVVENRKKKDHEASSKKKSHAKISSSSSSGSAAPKAKDPFAYKTAQGTSGYRFGVLAKIVKYMKQRHQDGDHHPLTLDEILDETNQLDVGLRQRHWLLTEALNSNPKILVTPEGKYIFRPAYSIKDKKGLFRLLDKNDQRGLGGVFLDDVQESLPNADRAIKILGDNIIFITRPIDKKKVLFYNDKNCHFTVDEEFQKLWRSVAVDGIDENKIEEYLEKQGITSMQDNNIKKPLLHKRKKAAQRKNRNFKRHNEHMGDILKDYSES